jgi:hypothetical protein
VVNRADKCTVYPPRFQFEASSGSLYLSQVNNCGPTGAAQQIDYYLGKQGTTRIEDLRLQTGVPRGEPTNAWQQAQFLIARGIPATVIEIQSSEQLDRLLGYGHRPIGIGVLMSRIKARTRGHDFLGWHRITLLSRKAKTVNGQRVKGYLYTDPNFRPPGSGYREDPLKGHRWISRYQLRKAFIENFPAYAIVPNRRKGV